MKTVYSHKFNLIQRFFQNCFWLWRISGREFEFKWGAFVPRFGFTFLLHQGTYFDNRWTIQICPIFGWWFIHFPVKTKLEPECEMPRYGLNIHSNALWVEKGMKTWFHWYLPFFHREFDGHWVLDKNSKYVRMTKDIESWEWKKENGYVEIHPYQYTLKSGKVQNVTATVYQDKRQWHRKWFPCFKLICEAIDVEFSDEVGEGSGSWKGGCIGCGYDLKPGESVTECLRRMEKERKFKR